MQTYRADMTGEILHPSHPTLSVKSVHAIVVQVSMYGPTGDTDHVVTETWQVRAKHRDRRDGWS